MVLWAPQWEFPAQWALKKHLQVCVWQQHRAITSHQCHRQPSPGQPPAQGLCWDRGRAVSDTWGDPCWRGQGSRDPTALLLVLHQCLVFGVTLPCCPGGKCFCLSQLLHSHLWCAADTCWHRHCNKGKMEMLRVTKKCKIFLLKRNKMDQLSIPCLALNLTLENQSKLHHSHV